MLCVLVIYYLSAYVGGFTLEVEFLADQYVCHLSVTCSNCSKLFHRFFLNFL